MNDQREGVRPLWLYTQRASALARESPYGSAGGGPYGSYMNRHIIGRDSRILGGISMVAGYPILIVVSEIDVHLPRAYAEVTARIARWNVRDIETLLKLIRDFVREKLRYTRGLNKRIRREQSPDGREVKLPLAFYLARGEGVCWQQGLLAAYLIEKLIDDGYIDGSVSADRNMKADTDGRWRDSDSTDEYVGHQWARYTAPDGTAYIVDPAQEYSGRLADVLNDPRELWRDYFRPEDPRPPTLRTSDPPTPKQDRHFDELDMLVAAGIVAAAVWHFVF